jgi:hypothetical protein
VLPPGGEGEVKVTLHPKGNAETISKRITVVSDDPEHPRFALTMQGKLLVDVRAKPASLNLNNIQPGDPASLDFAVTITDPSATKLLSIGVEDSANFELQTRASETPGELAYTLRFRGSKQIGSIGSRVEVRTNGANTPDLNIPIRAVVASNLRYPKRLMFNEKDGEFIPRPLRISTRDGDPPKISKVVDPAKLLEWEIGEAKGKLVVIELRVKPDAYAALPEDQRRKSRTLTVHTNDRDEPRIEITYTIGGTAVPVRAHR